MNTRGSLVLFALLLLCCLPGFAADLVMHVIDVGQADSILIRFPTGETMLVDAGNRADGPAVVHYLRSKGVKRIDILVATHPHEDHIGGMLAVLNAFKVGKVWDSGFNQGSQTQAAFLAAVTRKSLQYGRPKKGFTQGIGVVRIEVLAPGPNAVEGTDSDANNNSLVLRITYGGIAFLLAGDMEQEERNALGPWPQSAVLKVAHHGSSNGTDAAFAWAIAPRYAIVSYGRGNPYGHPHPSAVRALTDAGAKLLSTAQDGTVIVSTDGGTLYAMVAGKGTDDSSSIATRAMHPGGTTPTLSPPPRSGGGDTVYITRTGAKYHKAGCRYLARSCIPISRSDAVARGYSPCSVCRP